MITLEITEEQYEMIKCGLSCIIAECFSSDVEKRYSELYDMLDGCIISKGCDEDE